MGGGGNIKKKNLPTKAMYFLGKGTTLKAERQRDQNIA